MALNHHVMAKATTDTILHNFKTATWSYNGSCGTDFYRVGTSADFPSPDAAFFDPTNRFLAAFEFKPPTETKRGMLTGVGQSIAYLRSCDLAYLISPQIIDGFNIGGFLKEVYDQQLGVSIPVGLIVYENNNPTNLTLAHNVASLAAATGTTGHTPTADRFWAKHQDMPVALFHLFLHYYYLRKVGQVTGDAYVACWKEQMIPTDFLVNFTPRPVRDVTGAVIKTLRTNKDLTFLEKKVAKLKRDFPGDSAHWAAVLAHDIDTQYTGDNLYNSYRKNYVTFLKHIQVIDSEGNLTDSGFNLYHLGLVNGPTSKIFIDYFTRELLTSGHHLDLLLDIDTLKQSNPQKSMDEILSQMESDYEAKGYIKRNPNRIAGAASNTAFLKYEKIIWQALGVMNNQYNIQWRKVTEICALPEL